ncbi:solute carrier family 28 member 3-like [Nelusetta ayraudi]|uniref:solute carrier family 28 member 3-like n=1 Tax=Nelusetta ayraudi TaxID=303726 RepID=UPI003F71D2E4
MELNERQRTTQKSGQDNDAFVFEEDHMYFDTNSTAEEDEKHKEDDFQFKSFLIEKTEDFQKFLARHRRRIRLIACLVLAAGAIALVIAACVLNFKRAVGLLVIACSAVFFLIWDGIMERYGEQMWDGMYPIRHFFSSNWYWMKWVVNGGILAFVVMWFALDTAQRGISQVVSFFGLIMLVVLMHLFSKHPFQWSWKCLMWGIGIQYLMALITLRTHVGVCALQWLGDQVETFMSYTDTGSIFVFGSKYTDHPFAFRAMPIIVFLSSVLSILFYIGFMPWLICKLGFILEVTMGTSPTESVVAAGCVFLGQTDSLLLIRPYISKLTLSEIHAVMTAGLAGISGTMMGVYISFGVKASHLLTASVMTAPSSLAIAKAFWPETETSKLKDRAELGVDHENCTNVLEAASKGAASSVGLISATIVNIISFLALLTFFNAVLSWLGGMFGYPELSFAVVSSYVLMPLAYMMGVSWEDSFLVAELLGLKTFLNEFVAYQRLAEYIKRREAGGPLYVNNIKQYMSVYAETIVTYALCGFSNFASLGTAMGAMTAIAPDRRADIANCGIRALVAASVACFMTACIAGTLYVPEVFCPEFLNEQLANVTVGGDSQLSCCAQLFSSVTVYDKWNATMTGGFSQKSLDYCCTLTTPTNFNCSL